MKINTEEVVGPEESLAWRLKFVYNHPYEVYKFQGTPDERFEGRFSNLECAVATAMHVKGSIQNPAHTKNGVQIPEGRYDYPAVRREWSEMKKRRISSEMLPVQIVH